MAHEELVAVWQQLLLERVGQSVEAKAGAPVHGVVPMDPWLDPLVDPDEVRLYWPGLLVVPQALEPVEVPAPAPVGQVEAVRAVPAPSTDPGPPMVYTGPGFTNW